MLFRSLWGSQNNDTLTGDASANVLDGQGGDDTLRGGAADDVLIAGTGDDVLYGQAGSDILRGGSGADTFVLEAGGGYIFPGRADAVFDYVDGTDKVGLAGGHVFADLTISASGSDTLIQITSSGEYLAVLIGANAASVTSGDFISI